jgi:hypothetical protein
MAVTRARIEPRTRAYLDRKLAEGTTRAEAYRCLKRHLAREVWHLLSQAPNPRPAPTLTIHCNTPVPMLALT